MEDQNAIELPIVLLGIEDTPMLFINQVICQFNQDEFIVTMAQMTPPVLLGTAEEQRRQASQVPYVPAKVVARLAFTRSRLSEVIQVLQSNLAKYDELHPRGGGS